MNKLFLNHNYPEPEVAPTPTIEPATHPTTEPDTGNDPWKVPSPQVEPTPKA